jgi:hypothetical protein
MPLHAGEIEQEHYLAADAETAAPPGIAETRNDGSPAAALDDEQQHKLRVLLFDGKAGVCSAAGLDSLSSLGASVSARTNETPTHSAKAKPSAGMRRRELTAPSASSSYPSASRQLSNEPRCLRASGLTSAVPRPGPLVASPDTSCPTNPGASCNAS